MTINVLDRIPTPGKANRKLITPEGGGAPFYATITYADDASPTGSPVNRAVFMAMQGFYGNVTVFNSDGSITETNQDGDIKNTIFNADGSITETFTAGGVSISKKTTFNPDGSITEELI